MSQVSSSGDFTRFLRPERFDVDPSSTGAELKWRHWKKAFDNFISAGDSPLPNSVKLKILINHLSPSVFSIIQDTDDYEGALKQLNNTYVKPHNEIHARHMLSTRKQLPGESIDEYLRALKVLSQNCNFKEITAEGYKTEYIRDAFISGISSKSIRQRLLENLTLTLEEAHNQASSLEMADKNCQSYTNTANYVPTLSAVNSEVQESKPTVCAAGQQIHKKSCFFCGGNVLHRRFKCPAYNSVCQLCSKKGHFASVCRGTSTVNTINPQEDAEHTTALILAASPASLSKATIPVTINDSHADALIDTGSSVSFINLSLAETLGLKKRKCQHQITLASLDHTSSVEGMCIATLKIRKHTYKKQPLLIVNRLCADVILGHDILKNHSSLELDFGGNLEPLKICNVMAASVPPATIFSNLTSDIKPVAIKSRRYSDEDKKFIAEEINKLLEDKVIEPCVSPWRAQVLVAGGGMHRKRLVIDYSLTINRYTELDAFPLPNIESIVSEVAKYNYFSQIDLKSAYHQVPILESEKKYTAFEADGNQYQFTRIPFGVTNGVAAFQRTLHYIITTEKLPATYAYLDDVTVCGNNKDEHDVNLKKFMDAVEKYKLTLNKDKSIFGSESINLLGYTIKNNAITPDEKRLQPLMDLPVPNDTASLKRALGMFAHYSKWISNFSEKISPLVNRNVFPLTQQEIEKFETLKHDIAKSCLTAIDAKETFTVETDASEHSLAATLTQKGRPVAFFSRSLNDSERRQSSIEKEAGAIVESLRKWRHYLIGKHFILVTDQQSVSFMFNQKHSSKIKNEKLERWRLELSCFKYDIIYRPGKENIVADALSRVCASTNTNRLIEAHDQLCHPGVTRMYHWVKSKNLPYSLEDIRALTARCQTCAEIKPRFIRKQGELIKATSTFERLNIDFKGPLPTNNNNRYILTIIDEYSRFPFAFPCKDVSASTVISCLKELFCIFGTPLYIHSDRGASFMSEELRKFLIPLGVACSRTTPYNPQGNGQVERLNGTLWRSVQLSLRSKNLPTESWQLVLSTALHSIRSLLCTSTNTTPHERMFNHPRRSPNGDSLPSWLMTPGPVLLKKNVRNSKYDNIVERVQLIEANPAYSHVQLPDGRETTVSNRQLAPFPHEGDADDDDTPNDDADDDGTPNDAPDDAPDDVLSDDEEPTPEPRRSARERRAPTYLRDYAIE